MFELSKELLESLKVAIIPGLQPAPLGPSITRVCAGCTGACKQNCTSGCRGSCKGGCTRSCKGNSR